MQLTITGATGLLGANLAVEALKAGHQVRCTKRATSRTDHLDAFDIEWVEATLSQPDKLTAAFAGSDAVLHCAAITTVRHKLTEGLIATNITGTENVLEAVRTAGVKRLVHCSSTVAVGLSEDGQPCTETQRWNFDQYGLDDGYAISKRDSEQRVMAAVADGLDAVVVNPGFMFGAYDQKPSSGQLILDLIKGRIPGYPAGGNNFANAADVARGMLLALDKGVTGERYILGGENLSYREVFTRICAVAGGSPPRFAVPDLASRPVGWFGDLVEALTDKEFTPNSNVLAWGRSTRFQFSSAKAEQQLGYATEPLEVGIQAALDFFDQRQMR